MLVQFWSSSNFGLVRPLKLLSCLCQASFSNKYLWDPRPLTVHLWPSAFSSVMWKSETSNFRSILPALAFWDSVLLISSHFTDQRVSKDQDFFWKLDKSKALEKCSQIFLWCKLTMPELLVFFFFFNLPSTSYSVLMSVWHHSLRTSRILVLLVEATPSLTFLEQKTVPLKIIYLLVTQLLHRLYIRATNSKRLIF